MKIVNLIAVSMLASAVALPAFANPAEQTQSSGSTEESASMPMSEEMMRGQQGRMPMMMQGRQGGMPMMQGQQGDMPMMMRGRQGGMPMMQMMHQQRGEMQAHMKRMEAHLQRIESLLTELVELAKK